MTTQSPRPAQLPPTDCRGAAPPDSGASSGTSATRLPCGPSAERLRLGGLLPRCVPSRVRGMRRETSWMGSQLPPAPIDSCSTYQGVVRPRRRAVAVKDDVDAVRRRSGGVPNSPKDVSTRESTLADLSGVRRPVRTEAAHYCRTAGRNHATVDRRRSSRPRAPATRASTEPMPAGSISGTAERGSAERENRNVVKDLS